MRKLTATTPLRDLFRRHQRAVARKQRELRQIDRQRDQLSQRVEVLHKRHHFITDLVEPIARQMEELTGWKAEVLGPFGICCEVSIHLHRPTRRKPKQPFARRNCRSITFVPLDAKNGWRLGIRNSGVDTGDFKRGTIGEMNGMNHPTLEIPPDADVRWLVEHWLK